MAFSDAFPTLIEYDVILPGSPVLLSTPSRTEGEPANVREGIVIDFEMNRTGVIYEVKLTGRKPPRPTWHERGDVGILPETLVRTLSFA